jgi:hypothetical protein
MIVAGMATMPDRLPYLERTVAAIRPQVDELRVYLNNFDAVPDFLEPQEARLSAEANGDLGAEGKFFWIDNHEGHDYDHYLTIDDDIGYPYDYVERLVDESEQRYRRAIIGVHGSTFLLPIKDFVTSRDERFRFYEELAEARRVHLLGTATTLFSRGAIDLSLEDFPARNTSDLQLAIAAQNQQVPMIAIPREAQWMTELRPWTAEGFSIWKSTKAEGHSHMKTLLAQTAVFGWQLIEDPAVTSPITQV